MSILFSVMLAAIFAAVVMVGEHYWPWRYLVGRDRLHPIYNYILGLLGILLPYTALLIWCQFEIGYISPYTAALALWAIVVSAGLTVGALYALDSWHERGLRAREAEEREALRARQMEERP
jgi:hypothetical protein